MPAAIPFGEILEAADQLSPEEQKELADILIRRWAQNARHQIAAEIHEARQEFAAGKCTPTNPDELIHEIMK